MKSSTQAQKNGTSLSVQNDRFKIFSCTIMEKENNFPPLLFENQK
jgi:hypothetical protein